MAISVSVISHAFVTEKGVSKACSRYSCRGVSSDNPSDRQVDMKTDNIPCECMQSQDMPYMAATLRMQMTGSGPNSEFLMSPRSAMAASPSPRTIVGASPSPRLMAAANSSPRTGGGKSRKKHHKKRGRRRGQDGGGESKEPKIMHTEEASIENGSKEGAQPGASMSCVNRGCGDDAMLARSSGVSAVGDGCGGEGVQTDYSCSQGICSNNINVERQQVEVDVMVHKVREECSSALGIAKEDLELFGLCHIPSSVERVTLLKDKCGIVHLGVMVCNSDTIHGVPRQS
ncbi:hypothetical protein L7F22_067738 [Adiantum nelumboides]|nr:hypothetical protein [Adiantum nelumboides]